MDEFGHDFMKAAPTVLPTAAFFPDAYDGSGRAVRQLFERVCGYMHVRPELIDLAFYSEGGRPALVDGAGRPIATTAGLYEGGGHRATIHVERRQLHDPMALVGTMAHELAHCRTLGERRCHVGEYDNELLTDLTTVFHGMGVFLANVPRHWESAATTWPGTDAYKPEYMTAAMFGYALALRCWLRREALPDWKRHLAAGVRAEFKAAYRFLTTQVNAVH
jgi:hypothetical protein